MSLFFRKWAEPEEDSWGGPRIGKPVGYTAWKEAKDEEERIYGWDSKSLGSFSTYFDEDKDE